MNKIEYKKQIPSNFRSLRLLDKYMPLHRGFIAGGVFKHLLTGKPIKDIDIFFYNSADFQHAIDMFNNHNGFTSTYQNNNAYGFKEDKTGIKIDLIESIFGKPEEILNQFDFTLTKAAYIKEKVKKKDEDGEEYEGIEYRFIYHTNFFEHLFMKRLVLDDKIPFPISTFNRALRYTNYGYNLCRESKIKLLNAIQDSNVDIDDEMDFYVNGGGWD